MLVKTLLTASLALTCTPGFATLASNANVTPDAIWGSGNSNGGFQVFTDSASGLELGLRARVRYPSPSSVTNVSGNTYTHQAGLAGPGLNRAFWNFDYSVNSDYNGNGNSFDTAGLTFRIDIDSDPSAAVNVYASFDPLAWGDTEFGTNATANGAGVSSPSPIPGTNVGQNSLNYGFIPGLQAATNGFTNGQYTITLSAFDSSNMLVGASTIVVNAIPEPTAALFGALLTTGLGATIARRRRDEIA
jgi:hypothetical protein